MSHVDYRVAENEQRQKGSSFIALNETTPLLPISNVLTGIVISKSEASMGARVRIRLATHTDLRVLLQATLPRLDAVTIGQRSASPFLRTPYTWKPAAFGVEHND